MSLKVPTLLNVQIINMVPTDESSVYKQDAGHAYSILYNTIHVLLCRS